MPTPILNPVEQQLIASATDQVVTSHLLAWLNNQPLTGYNQTLSRCLARLWAQTGRTPLGALPRQLAPLLARDAVTRLPRPIWRKRRKFANDIYLTYGGASGGVPSRDNLGWVWCETVFEPLAGTTPTNPEQILVLGRRLGVGDGWHDIGDRLAAIAFSPPHNLHDPPRTHPSLETTGVTDSPR